MSQKDSLTKLKNFFRMDKNSSGSSREKTDADLLRELENILPPTVTSAQRCKTLKELCESDKINRLEDATILRLWELTKDLITSTRPFDHRFITYRFYQKLVQCQYEDLSLMRVHFFRVIQNNDNPEDVQCQLDLLKILTDNGKNIKDIDDVIGDFILNRWLAKLQDTKQIKEILIMVHNIIVYNAAYLDPDIVDRIITYACLMCCTPDDIVLQCLDVLDAILCYTVLPNKMLPEWVNALCRTVNREIYVQKSWDIMKKLLGTKMGHAALLYMCNVLNNSTYITDDAILRGAVFYINMGLWGSTNSSKANDLFKQSPTSVLQSFLIALKSQRVIVTYEVIIGIQRLIQVSGRDLSEPTWDVLCEILRTIADNIHYYEKNDGLPKDSVIQIAYHEALDKVEQLLQKKEAATDPQTIYSVIEYVCERRPEESIIHLMEYKATKITPTQTQWLSELNTFMDRFFLHIENYKIRDKSLQVLKRIMDGNRSAYEEEILESIVIPTFANIAHESDAKIRTSVGELLLKFAAQCDTKRSIELLDIVEKLLNRPFDRFVEENRIVLKSDEELSHITTIIEELIRVFLSKLYTLPTAHAIKIFMMLNAHLEKYYQKTALLEASVPIRSCIFDWLLRIRANANYYVGYMDDLKNNRIRFSHFLSIDANEVNYHQANRQQQSQPPALKQQSSEESETQSTISIKRSCKIIIDCLAHENDWSVMQLVLKGLPLILQNKALFRGVDVEPLAAAIMALVAKPQHPNIKPRIDTFVPSMHKPQLSDFQALVINSIASLIPYHQNLSTQLQNRMITCLRPGLLSLENTPRVCIQAFTVMLMEILDLMLRHLAEILFDMSRMSTTLNVAVPVLEFLSTLSRLPSRLFANFTNTQYMYVFAISLPYTNPHKYDHYTVSLAHHVIAGWFLKCKLSWRKDFVLYILKGLTTNVQKPFEEMKRNDYAPVNEDSSNRKRSSSLTERGAKQRERPSLQNLHLKSDESTDEVAYNFHMELADTCIDFLSRHTYSTCSALPKRSPTAEYLLANGHSMSWLIGHNLVTITTSGCSSTAVRNGLCDRCILVCKSAKSTEPSSSNGATSPEISSLKSSGSELCRRYTKATLQHHSGEISESSDFVSSNSSSMATPFGINSDTNKFFKSTSNEGRFNSSGSLDALSRRGSNPDTLDHSSETVSKHGSISHPMYLSPQQSIERIKQVCICACSGWAEIVIRRPTGNMSWIMKIQNHIALDSLSCDVPLQDLINMCTPSLGEIYNFQDVLNEEPLWSSNVNITNQQNLLMGESAKKKVTVEAQLAKPIETMDKKQEPTSGAIASGTHKTDNININTVSSEGNSSYAHSLSGPINIPKASNTEKIPSGSFSDIEPDDDDGNGVAFDENESKSRNPVRRVNSSPEMSSNWRHPFIGQKPNQTQTTGVNLSTHNTGDDEFNIDSDQQQKKKNLRPSCEAIPEEIGDATPPKSNQVVQQKSKVESTVSVVASGTAKNQHNDFISKSNSAQNKSSSSSSSSSTTSTAKVSQNSSASVDSLTPYNQSAAMPRKQHSADDALQQQDQAQSRQPPVNEPRHSSSGSAINLGASSAKFKLNIDMPNLATKPPQSHAPLSPRMLARNNLEMSHLNSSNNFNDFQRGRSKTISVVREHDNRDNSKWTFKGTRSVLSPNSIFLQLFYTGPNKVTEQPLLINPKNSRTIDMINYIPPFETHKIGVLYVGRGQTHNEIEILSNRYGSLRYMDFIQNLGALVSLKNAKELNLFIDMETDGRDGNFTYIWQDDIIQVTFHVATLMPNKDDDPNRTEKKKNIGNDYVTIVYNESGEDYNLNTIKGQFNYACVIIEPLELNSNRIFVRCKDDVAKFICHTEPKIISDASAPGYARQLALHANLASLVAKSLQTKNARPYASNWLERLRRIKHLRAKILKENGTSASASNQSVNSSAKNERETEDFTQYT